MIQRKKDNNNWYPVMNTTKDVLKNAPGFKYDRNARAWIPEQPSATIGGPRVAPQPQPNTMPQPDRR